TNGGQTGRVEPRKPFYDNGLRAPFDEIPQATGRQVDQAGGEVLRPPERGLVQPEPCRSTRGTGRDLRGGRRRDRPPRGGPPNPERGRDLRGRARLASATDRAAQPRREPRPTWHLSGRLREGLHT